MKNDAKNINNQIIRAVLNNKPDIKTIRTKNPSKLKQYRSNKQLTIKEMADRLGTNEASIVRYENGKCKIPNWIYVMIGLGACDREPIDVEFVKSKILDMN
jgi:DNA-binding XRE family transcriptional regulator